MKITIAGEEDVGLSNAILLTQHNEVVALDIIGEKVDMIRIKNPRLLIKKSKQYLATKELN